MTRWQAHRSPMAYRVLPAGVSRVRLVLDTFALAAILFVIGFALWGPTP